MQNDNIIVSVEGLSRSFGKIEALDGVSLSITRGTVLGLVGTNAAGKTTLIKHVLGLLRAKHGKVRVFGMDPVRDCVKVLSRVGYLSENRDLPDWMRVGEMLEYQSAFYPAWDMAYAYQLCQTFGLDKDAKINNLSRGQRAQAGLVAAVAFRPELLVLDEPSSGLDPVVRRDILAAIVRAVVDEGRSVLFSSHLLEEVERMSDEIAMIHEGHMVLSGGLDEVREAHHRLSVTFENACASPPSIPGVLHCDGSGRDWSLICDGAVEGVRKQVVDMGGDISGEQNASLEEVFVARVGRKFVSGEED